MPRVLNKRRDIIPEGAVYVGRPSKWANPYKIGRDGNRAEVIAKFRYEHLPQHPELVEAAKKELRDKDLVCWCAPEACHGDIWLEIANA